MTTPAYQSWVPTYGANGAMTYTSVTTAFAEYIEIDKMTNVLIRAQGTTGGVASTALTFTLPLQAAVLGSTLYIPIYAAESGTDVDALVQIASGATVASVIKLGGANWGLGADRFIIGSFVYRAL